MKVSIVGASGYGGGELLRLLLGHPYVEVNQVTSERNAGKPVTKVHPNLRRRTSFNFCTIRDLEKVDLLFLSLPHTQSMQRFDEVSALAERIVDLSADFRLKDPAAYPKWYEVEHAHPDKLSEFVYGNVELHRNEMKTARYISGAGCNATATILPLWPLFKLDLIDRTLPVVAEAKCGSSEGGNAVSEASHHPERSGCVRSYKPTGHRHIAEMEQELGHKIYFSATSIEMVRGILVTAHLFVKPGISEKDIWKTYRQVYGDEPFIRIVKEKQGIYRFPEPKILAGTNYCDIGFELDGTRLVVVSAIDNLMKGAAGQAVHAMNVMCGFEETTGLNFAGLHPI
ncbi:MAG TPA: N-acetyl-gamma-glutamyl-phosphate reductase [Thermodesulfobacteriota bacterium]|nr:N-acetyl-gamma-glutamyl-phosphate reductase [Thermodesulfobacteriota bacterium]